MPVALLLGAGFSKWAVNLPVAGELFDFLVMPFGPREDRKLSRIKALKLAWDQDNPGGLTEQFVAYALSQSQTTRRDALWYVARRLSEPFIWQEYYGTRWRRQTLMIDEDRRFQIPGMRRASSFLLPFCRLSSSGIVTTNYDMVIEYALGTRRFNYGIWNEPLTGRGPYPLSTWLRPTRLKGRLSLAKIHGSISWDEIGRYTNGRRAITGNALLVAPTPEKTPPRQLSETWTLAAKVIEKANSLLVFGFAFNPYDEAVLCLLKAAGAGLDAVLIVDISPNLEGARRLWPQASLSTCQPPPIGEKCIERWMETWL